MAEDRQASEPRGDEGEQVAALLRGDSRAFAELVDRHNDTMLRVARALLPSVSVAEEVVQETWLAILMGLPKFEARSSLKTWMFRILTNRARTRARREGRTTPLSALGSDDAEPPVDADAFDQRGMWKAPPDRWEGSPEKLLSDQELGSRIDAAIEELPERQRMVLTLRDVKGWTSEEVRNVMEISETNQRVLLHRARARVRSALDAYLKGGR